MKEKNEPLDREKFLTQFQGMEDLAQHAVDSFLESRPALTQAIEAAIGRKNPEELEIAAHTLKGVVSNFFAEPSRLLAWRLEQLGHGKRLDDAESLFKELEIELEKLALVLSEFSDGRLTA